MSNAHGSNTFFLTPDEADRVRNNVKGRLQKCQELTGQPRELSNASSSKNQIATASLLADFAQPESVAKKNRPDTMVAFAAGLPYPPCTVSRQKLQPISLSDLRLETHHRGHILTVKRVAPVVKLLARSWTIVQAEATGQTERLEVFLHRSEHGNDVLESSSAFMIREPYFTLNDQSERTIRVDHPSDLALCPTDYPNGADKENQDPERTQGETNPPLMKAAEQRKIDGNAALKQKDLPRAHSKYTEGVQMVRQDDAAKTDIACDLFRNRAHVNLLLNRFDEARADALASLTGMDDSKHKDLDSKAYFRAGCAAYNLGDFQEAKFLFEQQQKLAPTDKDAKLYLRKIEARLQEQASGVYDWKKIKAGLSKARPRVDAASFAGHTKVRESSGRGRGLFATRPIGTGDLVLCEKAFCVVWGHESEAWTALTYDVRDDMIRGFPAGLHQAIVQKLQTNPSQIARVMDLYGDYEGIGKRLITADDVPVIDVFQAHDIIARNAFGPGAVFSGDRESSEDVTSASTGLWTHAAYINHSCMPNAKVEYIGDLMLLYAIRPIGAGEEITHCYNDSSDLDARKTALRTTWGFTCTCGLCAAEEADGPALRKKRNKLEQEAKTFMQKEASVKAKRLSIMRAERLGRAINETYDNGRYQDMPRVALSGIQKWLAEATPHATAQTRSR